MYKITLIKNDGTKSYDITSIVNNISWDSGLSMYCPCNFSVSYHDMPRHFPKNPCDLGDVIMLSKDNEEIHRWILSTEGKAGRDSISYTGYDYAWYLGKSSSVYQFNKIAASEAITKVLIDFGMLIGAVAPMSSIIDEIYIKQSPAYIIQDILRKHEALSGKKYTAEIRKGHIYIVEQKDLVIKGSFKQASNTQVHDAMDFPINADRTRTIESMRNRIKILVEGENESYEVVATSQDESLISKYGLIEETFTVDVGDIAKAREVSRILLERLGKIQETNSISLMGDPAFRGGYLIDINEEITGMNGRYLIMSVKHSINNQVHTMDLELVLPEDVR